MNHISAPPNLGPWNIWPLLSIRLIPKIEFSLNWSFKVEIALQMIDFVFEMSKSKGY